MIDRLPYLKMKCFKVVYKQISGEFYPSLLLLNTFLNWFKTGPRDML